MTLMDLIEVGTIYFGYENYKWPWDGLVLDNRIDKELLVDEILNNCAQSYVIYSTCHTFKAASNNFFKKWSYQIGKLLDTQAFVYNPIWNKDGKIKETHQLERNLREDKGDEFTQHSDFDSETTGHSDTADQVSAFNSSGYQPYESSNNTSGGTENNSSSVTSSRDIGREETEGLGEITERTEQGNIGVTSTQSLIKEERELYEFNIYEWIVDKYKKEMFLTVF